MKSDAVIFDIDGTLSVVGDRIRHVRKDPPDWESFYRGMYNDEPNLPVIDLMQFCRLAPTRPLIIFMTGRPIRYESVTRSWIKRHSGIDEDFLLLMRPDDDFRPDHELKAEEYRKIVEPKFRVLFWIEDRDSVVRMVREDLGLPCFQVKDGDF